MTDRRPLLRAIFDAAVAAAHPDVVLSAHLRPAPKGRVICLAAGKAAAAMAAAAERHYLDALGLAPSRLSGVATTRHGHGVPTRRIKVIEAGHPVPDEAGLKGAEESLRLGRGRRRRRSAAGAVVRRRLGELDRAGRGRFVRAEAAGDPGAAALGRADRRDQHRPQASVADQGRPAGARRTARRDRDAGDLGRAARRSLRDRLGTDGAGSDHAGGCPRPRREIRPRGRRRRPPRARRPQERELQARRSRLCARAIRTDRAAEGFAARRRSGSQRMPATRSSISAPTSKARRAASPPITRGWR